MLAAALSWTGPAAAAPVLGSAARFVVLGASMVTNAGPTELQGDLGVSPGIAITGTQTVSLAGNLHNNDGVAQQAQADALSAYRALAALTPTTSLTGQDLGGMTLFAGVYSFASTAQLTGTLTLDAQNDPDAMFVFQVGSTLTTAGNSVVNVLNGSAHDVFWQVGSSATLGGGSVFAGSAIADQSVTINAGVSMLCGRAIALNAAITLNADSLSNGCLPAVSTVPEPPTSGLLILGLALLPSLRRRAARDPGNGGGPLGNGGGPRAWRPPRAGRAVADGLTAPARNHPPARPAGAPAS
jgi:type VI secretion system secreted protein VgrG